MVSKGEVPAGSTALRFVYMAKHSLVCPDEPDWLHLLGLCLSTTRGQDVSVHNFCTQFLPQHAIKTRLQRGLQQQARGQ